MTSTRRDSSRSLSSPAQSGRILAVDYGRWRIGLAVCDELELTAQPLAAIERKNRRDDMRRLRNVVRQYAVRRVVVGSPIHLDGHRGEMAEEAERFAGRVRKETGLAVELRDERLTSWEAEELAKKSRGAKRKKTSIDSLAAAILLREHLDELQSQRQKSSLDEG